MKYLFSCIFLFLYSFLYCQKVDFAVYQQLQSQGPIPNCFTEFSEERYNMQLADVGNIYKKDQYKDRKDFLLKSNYHVSEILHSGKVVFGDEVTQYIQNVAKELLKNKPDIYKQLQFFTLRTSTPNASSTAQGIIFVNTGLIAKLNNEAELAFVIAHEVAHYIAEDPINSYLKNVDIINGRTRFNIQLWYNQINQLGKYSREVEFKADSLGVCLFLESGYSSKYVINSLQSLYYSELPIGKISFDQLFFNTAQLTVPKCYYSGEIPPVSAMKETDDELQTHPNLLKRIEKIKNQIEVGKGYGNQEFIVSKQRFNHIQKITSFEQIRLNILAGEYGNAIYDAYCLLKEFPNNKYLEINIAKALYGLARYKNADEYQKVAKSYSKIEGESYQVHYFLRQLTNLQLTTIALNYVWDLMQKFGSNNCLDQLETGLINDLVINNEMTLSSLKKTENADNTIRYADDRNNYSLRELQTKFKDFYKPVYYNKISDERIIKKFDKANEKLQRKKEYENLSFKEKEKFRNKYRQDIIDNGLNYSASKVYILDPFFDKEMLSQNKSLIESEKSKVEYENAIVDACKTIKLKTELLSYTKLKSDDVATYNFISACKDVFYEVMSNQIEGFYPIGAYLADEIKEADKEFLCINGMFETDSRPTYYNLFIEMKSGKIVFVNDESIININNSESNSKLLKKDLLLFKP